VTSLAVHLDVALISVISLELPLYVAWLWHSVSTVLFEYLVDCLLGSVLMVSGFGWHFRFLVFNLLYRLASRDAA
jgi:hypothetical protein